MGQGAEQSWRNKRTPSLIREPACELIPIADFEAAEMLLMTPP